MPGPGTETRPRCRRPGANRWSPESPRRVPGGERYRYRCGAPASRRWLASGASYGIPFRRAQTAQQQFVARDFGLIAIQWAGRRTVSHLAIDGEQGVVARADELGFGLVPVVRTAQVGALRAESAHAAVGCLHHPGGDFLADDLPAVDAISAERHLDRLIGREIGDIARVDPRFVLAGLRGEKEVGQGGCAETGCDDSPDGIHCAYVESTARGFASNFGRFSGQAV